MGTHYRGKATEVRALDAFIKLSRAHQTVHGHLERLLAAHSLTESQLGVLEALLHLGPMCQRALGEKLFTSGANVTLLVDALEKRGLVRRDRNPEDRRFITLSLTSEGRKLIEKVFPAHAAAISQAFGALSAAEQEELARLCKLLGVSLGAAPADDDASG